jgi:hypothetical protein
LHVAAVLQERLGLGPIQAIWIRDRLTEEDLGEVARIAASGETLLIELELRELVEGRVPSTNAGAGRFG